MDDALATQLASAMTGIAAGDYRTEGTAASATFTVKEKFGCSPCSGGFVVVADVAIDADGFLPRGTATLDVAGIETPNVRHVTATCVAVPSSTPTTRPSASGRSARGGPVTASSSTGSSPFAARTARSTC